MKKNSAKKIAVLLTCYNRKEQTLGCLESLMKADLPQDYNLEVFLVDDGSTDGTGDEVKKLYPKFSVIKGDGNLYWNRGMNLAWQTATKDSFHDFYLWLNDDVILYKESIKFLLNDFQQSGSFNSIIAGSCQSKTQKVTYSGYKGLKKKTKIEPNGSIQECGYFNGNVVLIPSSVFKKVGYLNPVFHHGIGDFDYGLRAKEKGIKSFVSSSYVGICELNKELQRWCNPKYSLSSRWENFKSPSGGRPKATFIFQRKHIGLPIAVFHYFTIHLRVVFPSLWLK